MLTILIVDDEKNIRAGIRKILSESIAFDARYLEAKNGIEALEFVESENPELIITDIRMPKMDGIELMKDLCLREAPPDIIVLSGYDEFSYAKEAIKCGAVSYILKPVDRDELVSVVTLAVTGIERRKKSSVELTIQRMMSEGRMLKAFIPGNFSFNPPFYFAVITGLKNPEELNAIIEKKYCYVLEEKSNNVSVLIREESLNGLRSHEVNGPVRIGISSVCNSLANLRTAWRQAVVASLSRFFVHAPHVYFYSEPESPFDRTPLDAGLQKLTTLVASGDAGTITVSIDALFDFTAIAEDHRSRYLYILLDYISAGILKKYWEYADSDMYLTAKSIMIENFNQYALIGDYRKSVLDYILYLNNILRKAHVEHSFIAEALQYISAHFTEDINMTIVANHVSVNYTYFSEKFKEHTGGNFNDYLKNLRIEEAKRLLEKGCFKVYEVAANSGFGDVKYFMRTFKETTGLTPGEYRKKF